MAKPKCFIIMPITTPEALVSTAYSGDSSHFQHVLEYLFIPAVESAGFEAIPPTATGDELIHGRIIKMLEESDLVLCDMSTLNANVFFELGVRTSLNKPATLVKDTLTPKPPFDLSPVNYHDYSHALKHWEMPDEIDKLVKHLPQPDALADSNSLWRTFGAQKPAEPHAGVSTVEDQLSYVNAQIESLRNAIAGQSASTANRNKSSGKGDIQFFVDAFTGTVRRALTTGGITPDELKIVPVFLENCLVLGLDPRKQLRMSNQEIIAGLEIMGIAPKVLYSDYLPGSTDTDTATEKG